MNRRGQESFVAFFLVGVLSGFCLAIWLFELNLLPKHQPTEPGWKGEWECIAYSKCFDCSGLMVCLDVPTDSNDWRLIEDGKDCKILETKCTKRVWVERRKGVD